MASSRHLTDKDVEIILEITDAWPAHRKFGWKELRQAIQRKLQFPNVSRVWSRVQLAKYPSIYSAYEALKNKNRDEKAAVLDEDIPIDLRNALATITMLENKVKRLEQTNHMLYERTDKWLYNAIANGMTEDDIDKPVGPRQKTISEGSKK
jgi:hypothetical protein